jgi:hypothetical protein
MNEGGWGMWQGLASIVAKVVYFSPFYEIDLQESEAETISCELTCKIEALAAFLRVLGEAGKSRSSIVL